MKIKPVAQWHPFFRWSVGMPLLLFVICPFLLVWLLCEALVAAAEVLHESDAYQLFALGLIAIVFGDRDRSR